MGRWLFGLLVLAALAPFAVRSGEGSVPMNAGDAVALYERANALWQRSDRSAADVSEVVAICERLLSSRDALKTSEEGKAVLGKTYHLIGVAYNAKNEAGAGAHGAPRTGTVKALALPGNQRIEMIYCEPGEFVMGSPYEEEGRDADENQHKVTLTKGFWLSKSEVTQAQWQAVMGKNPSNFRSDPSLPVDSVSWNDCMDFMRKLNKATDCGARLPTEAEWEYACRAGTKTAYFWGNSLNGRRANCNGDFPCATRERGPYLRCPTHAGRYPPNPWGFFDMHGNMYEWCQDKCGDYPSHDVTDPMFDSFGKCRVMRGGCWYFGARFCRSANRIKNIPSYADAFTGLRLCCDKIP